MTVTAEHTLSVPLSALKTLLAASAACQAFLGADAAERIHLAVLPVNDDGEPLADAQVSALRPFALVMHHVPSGSEWNSLKPANGSLRVALERNVAPDVSVPDAEIAFENQIGAIAEEIQSLGLTGGHLIVRRVTIIAGPGRESWAEGQAQGQYHFAGLQVFWGLES